MLHAAQTANRIQHHLQHCVLYASSCGANHRNAILMVTCMTWSIPLLVKSADAETDKIIADALDILVFISRYPAAPSK